MKRHGFPKIKEAIKGAGSVEDGIEFLKMFDIIVHPDCVHTADELRQYSFKTDRQTKEVLPILEDKHNHVIDALRYALESYRRNMGQGIVVKNLKGHY
jgi:phage terminase large subunit